MQVRPNFPVSEKNKQRNPFNSRIKWLLFILFIVLLIVLFFRSSLSKIQEIRLIGNQITNETELKKSSGLQLGQSYFMVNKSLIAKRIKAGQPFIKSVQVNREFPGIVKLHIQEYVSVSYELMENGMGQAYLENGSIISLKQQYFQLKSPILRQWRGQGELKTKLCKLLTSIPKWMMSDISEIHYSPSPSYPDRIKLYTRSGFEVFTTVSLLGEKITYLNRIIKSQAPGRITMLKADSYIPYLSIPRIEHEPVVSTQQGQANDIKSLKNKVNKYKAGKTHVSRE